MCASAIVTRQTSSELKLSHVYFAVQNLRLFTEQPSHNIWACLNGLSHTSYAVGQVARHVTNRPNGLLIDPAKNWPSTAGTFRTLD